ncbi:MAG: hypothetical protein KBS95_03455 [Alistipes sp.]|nr:hypothetical protein [Candidatus Alistipes equi]
MLNKILRSILSLLLLTIALFVNTSCSKEGNISFDEKIYGIWKADISSKDNVEKTSIYLVLYSNATGEMILVNGTLRREQPIKYTYLENTLSITNAAGETEVWTLTWIDDDSFKASDGQGLTLTFERENIII